MIRKLIVEVKSFGKRATNVGECYKISDVSYRIRCDARQKFISQFRTLFHEFGHFLFWNFLKDGSYSEESEHAFLEELENQVEILLKKHLLGGK